MSAQVFVSAHKGYKGSEFAILKMMGPAIFKYKILFSRKILVLALDEFEVQI